jgi:predicted metal-dependent phosphoesterase TrpH
MPGGRRAVGPEAGLVDLHTHTNFSDGLFSPEELVAEAVSIGLGAIAVTDHDSMGGVERAIAAGRKARLEVVPGVEMSCTHSGVDVHMLGYYVDHNESAAAEFFGLLRLKRAERAELMVKKLNELGVKVSYERVRELAGGGAIGRPHVAQAVFETGVVPNVDTAFARFIGYDGPAYVPKMQLSPAEAVDFIHRHGGLAVVAHPGNCGNDNAVYAAIEAGVDGLEIWHPDHSKQHVDHYTEMARKNRLLMTGGSDCHGGRKLGRVYLGQVMVPYKYLQAMKNRRAAGAETPNSKPQRPT